MNKRNKITQKELNDLFIYDQKTGIVTNRVSRSPNAIKGHEAGHLSHDGSRYIYVNGRKYSTHRIIWMMVYGYFPEHDIDHNNGIRDANNLSNLREVSRSCNMQNACKMKNNSSGYRCVSWNKNANKWIAYATIHGKTKYIGLFTSKKEAATARANWEDSCHDWNCDLRHDGR